jgi:hypothetical protein
MIDFLSSWTGMGLMAVLLLALVGLLIYLRKQGSSD